MYSKQTGSYDEIPEGMKVYLNNYGCHFNKKLCEEAVSRMRTKNSLGKEVKLSPYSKDMVDNLLTTHGIKLKRNKLYDAVYVASRLSRSFCSIRRTFS